LANERGKKTVKYFLLSMILFVGCASKPVATNPAVAAAPQKVSFSEFLSDKAALMKDSEFCIAFHQENTEDVQKFKAKAKGSEFEGFVNSPKKELKKAVLTSGEYQELVAKLREVDETDMDEAHARKCLESFKVKVRVGSQKRTIFGCRGEGGNSTIISKLARELEFLILQKTNE
jgi:hypothetical protein